jgi:general secretion pathway protein B
MSILLDALRKSEKNQQAAEAPDIHAEDQPEPVSDSIQTGPLAFLLVLALFASGWFVWRQYQPPAGSYQPPVTLAPGEVRSASSPATMPEEDDGQSAQVSQPGTVSEDSSGRPRTPVESYQQPVRAVSQSEPDGSTPSTKNQPATQATVNNDKPRASRTAAPGEPVAVVREKQRLQEPAPISYWELPDSIRAEVPAIKFSVLVYATKPADRFVLINGQRLGEGDSSQPGLVVEEIRRDGVIFSYRLYRFLVER